MIRRTGRRTPAYMARQEHAALWRLIEGAVVDAFNSHPDYLTDKGRASVCQSVTKRVVGQLVSRAKETRKGGGRGPCSADGSLRDHSILAVLVARKGRLQERSTGGAVR